MVTIKGKFDVNLSPIKQTQIDLPDNMAIKKTYHGDLSANATGQMLSFRSAGKGSAGYVAIEKVKGKLLGKSGGFMLQHYGIMSPASKALTIEIIPDSGSGELESIRGHMDIEIKEGVHYYALSFSLDE